MGSSACSKCLTQNACIQTTDESMVPLTINCWPSASGGESYVNIEYDCTVDFDLQNVAIAIPLPALAASPKVNQVGLLSCLCSQHKGLLIVCRQWLRVLETVILDYFSLCDAVSAVSGFTGMLAHAFCIVRGVPDQCYYRSQQHSISLYEHWMAEELTLIADQLWKIQIRLCFAVVFTCFSLSQLGESQCVVQVDGDWRYDARKSIMLWSIDIIDDSNRTGSLEFVVPNTRAESFFPVTVNFNATRTLCQVSTLLVICGCEPRVPIQHESSTTCLFDPH